MKKFGLRLTGRRIWYFLIFAFSLYPNVKWQLSKSYNGFWGFLVISRASQIFLIYIFVTVKRRQFWFFFKFARICISFLYFFQNERKIRTSFLVIHLKCTVVHYANLNSSSKNKPFLNYGSLNMLFRFFFRFLMFILMMRLTQNLKKLSLFSLGSK